MEALAQWTVPQLVGAVAVGAVSLAVIVLFRPKHVPRLPQHIADNQSREIAGTSEFRKDVDEDGKPIDIYHGNVYVQADLGNKTRDLYKSKDGLVISKSEKLRTLYDFIGANPQHNDRPCFGSCVTPHEFADLKLPDGSLNPKPVKVKTPGVWAWKTYKEVKATAHKFGSFLVSEFKLGKGEKIAIWAGNCEEWMMSEFACHAFSWVSVSVYDTLGPDAASYICGDSGAKVLIVEPKTLVKAPKILKDPVYTANQGKAVELIVYFGTKTPEVEKAVKELTAGGIRVESFNDIVAKGLGAPVRPPSAGDLATIMYTSGTTGNPKGVKLSHQNLVSLACANLHLPTDDQDIHLSYLPLAHIFEREMQYMGLMSGSRIAFASNGSKALLADLGVVRPTLFAGVPRVYENVRDAVRRKMSPLGAKIFAKAFAAKKKDIETGCGYAAIWDLLVFNKTKKALGGRVKFCITGGAPISKDTLLFVTAAIGPVSQGYGATETAAGSCLTRVDDLLLGHVGPPMLHAQIKLVDVPSMNYFAGPKEAYAATSAAVAAYAAGKAKRGGDVWIRGVGTASGYYDPSVDGLVKGIPSNGMQQATASDFELDGEFLWFKTGDIGTMEGGRLRITDRKKNIFKTSLGEYVPVEEVEKIYCEGSPLVDFVFIPKETKVSYVACCSVVADSAGSVMKWAKTVPALAGKDINAIVASPQYKKEVLSNFAEAAKEKRLAGFLQVKDLAHFHTEALKIGFQEDWVAGVTCAHGKTEQLLTATFKVRRSQMDQYYGTPVYSKIYADRPSDHNLP